MVYIDEYENFNDTSKTRVKSNVHTFTKNIMEFAGDKNIRNSSIDCLSALQKKIDRIINALNIEDYKTEGVLINSILKHTRQKST